jgi:hypothetical protein
MKEIKMKRKFSIIEKFSRLFFFKSDSIDLKKDDGKGKKTNKLDSFYVHRKSRDEKENFVIEDAFKKICFLS